MHSGRERGLRRPLVSALIGVSLQWHAAAASMYRHEIETALDYFTRQAVATKPKVRALQAAVASGDVAAAQTAYVASRNEYEQIEVLAPGFGTLDCNIDCRANAYDNGEGRSPEPGITDDEFQGFHRIENLIFRDMNTSAAVPYADKLVADIGALVTALKTPSNFEFCSYWEGVIGLATEVGAKKMSSEEETYSDESVLIFVNNFIGIREASSPFIPRLQHAPKVAAALMDAYNAAMESVAPFVSTGGFTKYSEVSVEGRSSIQQAAYSLAAALIGARDALLEASGKTCVAEEEGEPECANPDQPEALEARAAGAAYFQAQYPFSLARVEALVAGIAESLPLEELKALYYASRPAYEQFEVLAPAFSQTDADLDARPDGFDGGETNTAFQGFHRIERMLFRDGLSDASDKDIYTGTPMIEWAMGLKASYEKLGEELAALPEAIPASDVFDGVIGVWTEVVAKKISSEEESWSDDSLMIFYNNWVGGFSQIAPFADGKAAATLAGALKDAMECILSEVHPTPTCTGVTAADVSQECADELATLSFTPYSDVSIETRECIVREGYKLRQAAIDLANNLGIPDMCHVYHVNNVFDYRHVGFLQMIEPYSQATQGALAAAGEIEDVGAGSYGMH